MRIIRSIKEMSVFSRKARLKGKSIGFVATMGALHQGHLSLIRQARKDNDRVVVSIFVNPTQFAVHEDLKKYPRPFKQDALLCRKLGVDVIFYPQAGAMYPSGYKTYVFVEDLSGCLCGKPRPGHFRGVATVVLKLFNIVQPDIAYFGQKDAQQAVIIKKMVDDLNLALKIKAMSIVRAQDGLALSSRNVYLNKSQRLDALAIPRSLQLAQILVKHGLKDAPRIRQRMEQMIKKKKSARIDYIEIVKPDNLQPLKKISGTALILLAVWVGKTRLIDNVLIKNG